MKTRIVVSAVLLPIFFAVLFIFPLYILALLISIIGAIAAFELLHATGIYNKRILVYSIISAVLTPMAVYLSSIAASYTDSSYSTLLLISLLFSIIFVLLCFLVIEVVLSFRLKSPVKKPGEDPDNINDQISKKQIRFRQIPIVLSAGVLIPLLLSALIALRALPYGHLFVLLPIVAAFLTDSGAYFTGVLIGKKKIFPTISPNKTLEGFIGGIITGTIGMLLYGIIISYASPLTVMFPVLILYGIIGAVITELGDLVFSLIKRKCNIKDYGRLIPGHGGALDRFDSMTFCAPTMFLLVMTIPAILY